MRNTEHHLTKSHRNRVLALFSDVCAMLRGLPRVGEWVFMTAEGNPWGNNVKRDFGRIAKKAGIAHCSMHDLRRTLVSQLAMAGRDYGGGPGAAEAETAQVVSASCAVS